MLISFAEVRHSYGKFWRILMESWNSLTSVVIIRETLGLSRLTSVCTEVLEEDLWDVSLLIVVEESLWYTMLLLFLDYEDSSFY